MDPGTGIFADPATEALRALATGTELPVTSADGTKLHAEVFGVDDAPTIVLIHGWTDDGAQKMYARRNPATVRSWYS